MSSRLPAHNQQAGRNFFLSKLEDLHQRAYVSRETIADLDRYTDLLCQWQTSKNLLAPKAFGELWQRHFIDGLHLRLTEPHVLKWMDWGSGAGLPAVVLAILLKDCPSAEVIAVEPNERKSAFLRTVKRTCHLPLTIFTCRLDAVAYKELTEPPVLTARALADLPGLINWAEPLLLSGEIQKALFIKGENWQSELVNFSLPQHLVLNDRTYLTGKTALLSLRIHS